MALLSLKELSQELYVPIELIEKLIDKQIITPYGGKARLGEPKFSSKNIFVIREKITIFFSK